MGKPIDPLALLPRPQRCQTLGGAFTGSFDAVETHIDSGVVPHSEGYTLRLEGESVTLIGRDEAGLFYGQQTLEQIRRAAAWGHAVPAMVIEDWPDFAERGLMIDISRDKVPTMATLKQTVDLLASMKINRLQLYTEHTFAYAGHEAVWQDASPMTPDEVRALDAYCRDRHVELMANQNTFGHMERWLKHEPYRELAECPGGWVDARGKHRPAGTLNPIDPGSIELVAALLTELAGCHTSGVINIGGDETYELGQGKSRSAYEAQGKGAVYLDFILKVHAEAARLGRTVQLWGDIVLEHPELVARLPADATAMVWGYEADHPFDAQCELFAERGVRYQVCPGTSGWNTIAGRTDNMLANISSATGQGLRFGAEGVLTTDWGDNGHWQAAPIGWPGYAWGAAESWSHGKLPAKRLAEALDLHVFCDRAGVMGRLALDLGNAYTRLGAPIHNASPLAQVLYEPDAPVPAGITPKTLNRTRAHIDQAIAGLGDARMERDDAATVMEEYRLTADLLAHGCDLLRARDGGTIESISAEDRAALRDSLTPLVDRYRRAWSVRNRPGGLVDSAGRFERLLARYA